MTGQDGRRPGPIAAVLAVLSAFFGVRKAKSHEQVKHLRPVHFIVAGVVLAVLFVVTIVTLVKLVTAQG
ncbi:MAG TPA: DUF2970 domain-containing protein [Pelomicrobium sp.]|nr:DUF2970 domain-containing protein [Pelomicrobium sp.]